MSVKNVRAKGHNFELRVAKLFRELGFSDCMTSRLESKRKDDMGVDLCYTDPFYIQCKAVENLGPTHNVLAKMPKDKTKINVVFHKRKNQGVVVSMSEDDFLSIVMLLKTKKLI